MSRVGQSFLTWLKAETWLIESESLTMKSFLQIMWILWSSTEFSTREKRFSEGFLTFKSFWIFLNKTMRDAFCQNYLQRKVLRAESIIFGALMKLSLKKDVKNWKKCWIDWLTTSLRVMMRFFINFWRFLSFKSSRAVKDMVLIWRALLIWH